MTVQKRVIVIGGTGFLGYHATVEFINKGWDVTSVGLPPKNPDHFKSDLDKYQRLYPSYVKTILLDVDSTPDAEMLDLLKDHQAIVFASGLDDRFIPKKPAYPKFHHHNVEIPGRILELSRQVGIKRAVILGSYFAYFSRIWPEMKLKEKHPYIRSRVEQAARVTTMPDLEGMVLELPYIFGSMPILGWKPLWEPLIKYVRSSPILLYMEGGSACVSAVTVGKAIVAAVERGEGGKAYQIGQVNLEWKDLLSMHASVEERKVKIITLPRFIIAFGMFLIHLMHEIQGKEGGLDLRHFSHLQTAKAYIDPDISRTQLGFEEGDFMESIYMTVQACRK